MKVASPGRWQRWAQRCLTVFVILVPVSATVGPANLNFQWSDLAAVSFLLSATAAGIWRRRHHFLLVWAAVYVCLSLPSFAQTTHTSASFLELAKTVYLACLAFTIVQWVSEPKTWDRLARLFALIVGVTVIIALGVWVYAIWSGHIPEQLAVAMDVPNVGRVVRVKAMLLTPTFLANYLTMGLPLLAAYGAAALPRPRVTSWVLLALGIAATGTTVSHSLAGCLTAAAMIAPRSSRWDRVGQRCLGAFAVAAIVFSMVATTVSVYGVRTEDAPAPTPPTSPAPHDFLGPQGTGGEYTIQIRYGWVVYGILKRIAWEAWQSHPWVGIGLGEFPYAVKRAVQAGRLHSYYACGADPHCTWLGAMAETGLIGLAGLLGFWGVLLSERWRTRSRIGQDAENWRIRAPLAGLVGLLVNSLYVDVMHFRFLWFGVALLLAAMASQTPCRSAPGHPEGSRIR